MNLTITLFCVYGAIGAATASAVLVLLVTNPGASIQLQRISDEQSEPWHMYLVMAILMLLVILTWPFWLVKLMMRKPR